jgi:hypothetical protein
VIETIARILSDNSVVLPTEIYNEGWMLRVTLDWYYQRAKSGPLAFFDKGARWFSEGRLSSQFLPRWIGDPIGERHTNADGALGHFDIAQRSEIRPRRNAKQLMILEAKLASKLSSGTKNAPGYDQAARNVGCLAHIAGEAGIFPNNLTSYGFYVISPQKRVGEFIELTTKESIRAKVKDRVAKYNADKLAWYNETFLPHLEAMDVGIITWENLLDIMESEGAGRKYRQFYNTCCEYANL